LNEREPHHPEASMQQSKARVLIVDDNRVVRDALADALGAEESLRVVATCGLTNGGPSEAVETARPDVVVLPAVGQRAIELTHTITRRFAGLRVVILGMKEHPETVTEAIEAGAVGYIAEDASLDDFRETIRLVARGETRLTPRIAATLVVRLAALASARRADERAKNVKLTPREIEILALVADGLTNKEIATQLHVEEQTVKNHIHNILERLSLRRRHQAVQYAWETGMLRKRA
jgi:DNA-binding NarL/FixJ family response regulator